jgi:hypothetical protein
MDMTSSLSEFPSHPVLGNTPTTTLEEGSQLKQDDLYDDYSPYEGPEYWHALHEERMEVEWTEANPVFDFDGMKERRTSQHAVEHSYAMLARRRRTSKCDYGRANRDQEPIGGRNDVWREGLEKGALGTYSKRRCRCDYCMQLAALAQERRTLRWAVRRAEQGKDWEGERLTIYKKPRWVDYEWGVEYGDVDAGEHWGGAECVLEPGRVPPMEVGLLELVRVPGRRSRRVVQAILSPYSSTADQEGTKGSLSATQSDLSIESSSPTPDSGDYDWEVLSLYSEWDQCSVRSL